MLLLGWLVCLGGGASLELEPPAPVELLPEMLRPKESCGLFFLAVSTCTSHTDTDRNQQLAEDM